MSMSKRMKRSSKTFWFSQISAVLLIAGVFLCVVQPARADYDVPSYDDGLSKMGRRDFDGAILEFNRAIGYNHRNAKAFFKRGQCFYYLQNFQLAIDDFTAAIGCDANNSEFFLWRGATYSKMADDPHSIADYADALRLDPKLLQAANGAPQPEPAGVNSPMFAKGGAQQRSNGRVPNERSVHNYMEAVRIVNTNALPVFAAGTVFSGIIRPEYPADQQKPFLCPDNLDELVANPKLAFDNCRKQLELNPRDPLSRFKRGLALQLMGKNQKAIDDFSEAISQQSNSAQFLLARAFVYHANHDEASANNDITRAHGVDPAVPAVIKFSAK